MAGNLDEVAEKKLKSRMTKIRKCNKDAEEKAKFSEKFGTSFEDEDIKEDASKVTYSSNARSFIDDLLGDKD